MTKNENEIKIELHPEISDDLEQNQFNKGRIVNREIGLTIGCH